MNKHKSNKIKENSNTVRHLIMGQIITTQNLVAIKEVRHAGQQLLGVILSYLVFENYPNHFDTNITLTLTKGGLNLLEKYILCVFNIDFGNVGMFLYSILTVQNQVKPYTCSMQHVSK